MTVHDSAVGWVERTRETHRNTERLVCPLGFASTLNRPYGSRLHQLCREGQLRQPRYHGECDERLNDSARFCCRVGRAYSRDPPKYRASCLSGGFREYAQPTLRLTSPSTLS